MDEPRVFIIHAGEDKDSIAFPIYNALRQQGLANNDIFLDDVSIHPGEVIRHKIISTLSSERLELVVIIVTQWLLNKHYWPKLEYETCLNKKAIFPIWVDDNGDNFNSFSVSVGNYSPTLKQLRARCVQRRYVYYELPYIAAEIVQQLSAAASPLETELDKSLDCSPYISHGDIAGFLRDYDHLMSGFRRNLLQHTMDLVTDEWRYVMKHAEITVHGPLMEVVFFSGDRTNKFVVHLNGENRTVHKVSERGVIMTVRDGTRWAWDRACEGVRAITGPVWSFVSKFLPIDW
ncbi:PREDICTED: uncharacterized protein LOC109477172 [Branchiostoma belcheri]|uniref:Uncharacterized protein LOC109477172 n=1 Tax=Branchiostoma belcheri TaxID=7741 RepID=A0A6P4ZS83_BRABE|nr:PREDICTED: uncharacterized protein LOC109477172 [Branchiostoma belcheri]